MVFADRSQWYFTLYVVAENFTLTRGLVKIEGFDRKKRLK
jgi:hypothetical protein